MRDCVKAFVEDSPVLLVSSFFLDNRLLPLVELETGLCFGAGYDRRHPDYSSSGRRIVDERKSSQISNILYQKWRIT